MKLCFRLLHCAVFLAVVTTLAWAQPKAPLPTLTTDDVLSTRPVASASPVTAKEESNKPTEKATTQSPSKPTNDPKKKAEQDWNERLKKVQEKLNQVKRQADQTEMQITQLRNQLFSATARSPESNGQINVRIGDLSEQRNRLRAEVQQGEEEVGRLEAEGKTNSYKVAEVSLTNEKGEPDSNAYQAEQQRLQTEIRDAQARIEVLQIRLNSIQAEVLKKGNGDNFTLNRLRQERDQITTELRDTKTRIEDLKNKLQTHRQKASINKIPLAEN